jgi:hypothetical protein
VEGRIQVRAFNDHTLIQPFQIQFVSTKSLIQKFAIFLFRRCWCLWEDLRGPLQAFECISAAGVAFRKSLTYDDKLSADTYRGHDVGDFVVGEIVAGPAAEVGSAASESPEDATNLLWYRLVTDSHVRVRRRASLETEQVGTVSPGSFPGNLVPVRMVEGNWLKLAPQAYATLQDSESFEEHDPTADGWCIMVSARDSSDILFEEASHPLGHPDRTGAWLALTLPPHGPLYLPLSRKDGACMFELSAEGTGSIGNDKWDASTVIGKEHAGEWRSEDRKQWCSKASSPEGLVCNHGDDIVRSPHWSCCGSTSETDTVCSYAPLSEGDAVIRGPDWKWDDQDGGPGGRGVVTEGESDGCVRVQWDKSGSTNEYRMGAEGGKRDLIFVPPPRPGEPRCGTGEHPLTTYVTPQLGIGCDICHNGIDEGTRAHGCRACNYDLCVGCFESSITASDVSGDVSDAQVRLTLSSNVPESTLPVPAAEPSHKQVTLMEAKERALKLPQLSEEYAFIEENTPLVFQQVCILLMHT